MDSPPLVTYTLTQLISTIVCRWRTPSPSQCGHRLYMPPLAAIPFFTCRMTFALFFRCFKMKCLERRRTRTRTTSPSIDVMDLVRQRVDGVWTPNFSNILLGDYGGESGEARAADCSMHPSDRYRDEIYSLYVVWRILFLLFLNCSAWPCLGPA